MSTAAPRQNPFPGLRSFEPDDDYLFFGRERQVDELLRRLRTHRFLAIVGTSGSGKSSLVRSGLIPALHGGAMVRAGSAWRVAILRPGADPRGNLATALYAPGVLAAEGGDDDLDRAFAETNLRTSNQGLVACVRQARLPKGDNVLVVVDQFEELFRFKQSGAKTAAPAAAAFVKLLLTATACQELPIYVALTMRSDFIGNCMEFSDLPEAVNQALYLVPRLTRDELRAAIASPVAVGGGTIANRLVLRLLNDVGDDPDQLPILQHALMRTWDRWQEDHAPGEPLDLRHYEAIGTMATALSGHAEEAYGELDPRDQALAATLFKALTDRDTDGRGIRRPAPFSEICALTGATAGEVAAVVERFRQPGRSFLMPPAGTPLDGETILDLSHESLMRIWDRLAHWVEDEARSAQLYLDTARAAARYEEGEAALWRDPELQTALAWREREKPTALWARRYDPGFDRAMRFLDASRAERNRARKRKRTLALVAAALALLILGLSVWAVLTSLEQHQQQRLITARTLAGQSLTVLASHPQRGLLLAREALRFAAEAEKPRFPPAEEALRQALAEAGGVVLGAAQGPVQRTVVSPSGTLLVTVGEDGKGRLWRLSAGDPPAQPWAVLTGFEDDLQELAISPDDRWLAAEVKTNKGREVRWEVRVWALGQGSGAGPQRLPQGGQPSDVFQTGIGAAGQTLGFSPGGRWLATRSEKEPIHLWDLGSSLRKVTLGNPQDPITSARFGDDHRLGVGYTDGSVELWDLTDGERPVRTTLPRQSAFPALAFPRSRSGILSLLAASGKRLVRLWVAGETAAPAVDLGGCGGGIGSLDLSPDSRWLVARGDETGACLWDLEAASVRPTPLAFKGRVKSVAFSPTGPYLFLAEASGPLYRFDLGHPEAAPRRQREQGEPIRRMSFDPQGAWLAAEADQVLLGAQGGGADLHVLHGHESLVNLLAFAAGGRWLVTGAEREAPRLWDLRRADPWSTFEPFTGTARELVPLASSDQQVLLWGDPPRISRPGPASPDFGPVALRPGGRQIAYGQPGRTILRQLGQAAQQETVLPHPGRATALAFNAGGDRLAVGTDDRIWLWDLHDPAATPIPLPHESRVDELAFSPDSRWLAAADELGTIQMWNLRDLATVPHSLVNYPPGGAPMLAFSPDGLWLATAMSQDPTVRLWATAGLGSSQSPVRWEHEGPVSALAWRPDGRALAVASRRTAYLRDPRSPQAPPGTLVGASRKEVSALSWSPDSRWLATGNGDDTVRLWDLAAKDPGATGSALPGDPGTPVSWSPDSTELFTVAGDRTIRRWELRLERLAALACKVAGRNLTAEEWKMIPESPPYDPTCPEWPRPTLTTPPGTPPPPAPSP